MEDETRQAAEQRKREMARERTRRSREKKKASAAHVDSTLSSPLSTENCPISKTEKQPLPTELEAAPLPITPPSLQGPSQIETRDDRYDALRPTVTQRLGVTVTVTLSVSITVLLCYLHAETYLEDGIAKPLSWAFAITFEALFVYFSALLSRSSLWCVTFFMAMFSYSLATMSYGVYKKYALQTAVTQRDQAKQRALAEIFNSTKLLAEAAAGIGAITKGAAFLKSLEEAGEKVGEPPKSLDGQVYVFQAIGLIVLRAIFMIGNAVLIHRIFSRKIDR